MPQLENKDLILGEQYIFDNDRVNICLKGFIFEYVKIEEDRKYFKLISRKIENDWLVIGKLYVCCANYFSGSVKPPKPHEYSPVLMTMFYKTIGD